MGRWRGFDSDDDVTDDNDAPDEMDEGVWELDPNDPAHPDHDLSVGAGPAGWDTTPSPPIVSRGVVVAITILVIIGLTVPIWFRLFP